jgi:CheY-like chemotaxis protein
MPSNTEKWKYPRCSPYERFPRPRQSNRIETEKIETEKRDRVLAKSIGVRALLVSADIQTIDTLCYYMSKLAMHVDVCSDFASAAGKLCHSKFEAIVVDFKDSAAALELLKKSREMTSHKAAVVIAILNANDEMPSAFRAGASFVLVKPISAAVLVRTLKVSHPLMVNEKRRYYRCPVRIPVYVSVGSQPDFMATSVNISEQGIAISNSPALRVGDRVVLRLTLTDPPVSAKVGAEVCWRNNAGAAGLQFVEVPAHVKEQLTSWLSARLEESLYGELVLKGGGE